MSHTPASEVARKRLNVFERYLSLWVGLCMIAGLVLGKLAPSTVQALRSMEFGRGSQVNVPIAVLIWLMIIPMMMKVDFGAIRDVGKKPRGLAVTLFVNWFRLPDPVQLLLRRPCECRLMWPWILHGVEKKGGGLSYHQAATAAPPAISGLPPKPDPLFTYHHRAGSGRPKEDTRRFLANYANPLTL